MAETPERDVATRLRDYREVDRDGYLEQSAPGWMSEAADLITRLSRELAEAREALRSAWAVVFLYGRNEHGSHVLPMPGTMLTNDEKIEVALGEYAEQILTEAEAVGHAVGHCVVTTWRWTEYGDNSDGSGWEYVRYCPTLTAILCGTPEEQSAALSSTGKTEDGT
jgi:hypothetical protein